MTTSLEHVLVDRRCFSGHRHVAHPERERFLTYVTENSTSSLIDSHVFHPFVRNEDQARPLIESFVHEKLLHLWVARDLEIRRPAQGRG